MIKKIICLISLMMFAASAFSATQCGPFYLKANKSGWIYVNGERSETQKITFLKEKDDYDNVKLQWRVKNAKAPGMLGMEQIYRDGKAILNVEVIRTHQSQIRIHGTYDCEKVD